MKSDILPTYRDSITFDYSGFDYLLLACILVLGTILRFWGLGNVGLHGDEETMAMPALQILESGSPLLPSGMLYPRAVSQLYLIASPEICLSARAESAAGGSTFDGAILLEFSHRGLEPLQAHTKLTAQPFLRLGFVLVTEDLNDLLFELHQIVAFRCCTDDFEVRWRVSVSTKCQLDRLPCRCVSLFDDEFECASPTSEIEIAFSPSVEISRAAKTQPDLFSRRACLPGMMDDENCHVMLALKHPQVCEHSRDF